MRYTELPNGSIMCIFNEDSSTKGEYASLPTAEKERLDRETLLSSREQGQVLYKAKCLKDLFRNGCAVEEHFIPRPGEVWGEYKKRVKAEWNRRVHEATANMEAMREVLSPKDASLFGHSLNFRSINKQPRPPMEHPEKASLEEPENDPGQFYSKDLCSIQALVARNIAGQKICHFVQEVTGYAEVVARREAGRLGFQSQAWADYVSKFPDMQATILTKDGEQPVLRASRAVGRQDFLAKRALAFDFDLRVSLQGMTLAERSSFWESTIRQALGPLWQHVSAIVESSVGKVHIYMAMPIVSPGLTSWQKMSVFQTKGKGSTTLNAALASSSMVEDLYLFETYCALERLLGHILGTDPAAVDPLRILSTPGFVNHSTGDMASILYSNATSPVLDPLTARRILQGYPQMKSPPVISISNAIRVVFPDIWDRSDALAPQEGPQAVVPSFKDVLGDVRSSPALRTITKYLIQEKSAASSSPLGIVEKKVVSPFAALNLLLARTSSYGPPSSLREFLFRDKPNKMRTALLSLLFRPDGTEILDVTGKLHLILRTIVSIVARSSLYDLENSAEVYKFYTDVREVLGKRTSEQLRPAAPLSRQDPVFKKLHSLVSSTITTPYYQGRRKSQKTTASSSHFLHPLSYPCSSAAELVERRRLFPFSQDGQSVSLMESALREQLSSLAPDISFTPPQLLTIRALAEAIVSAAQHTSVPCRHPLADPEGGLRALRQGLTINIEEAVPVQETPGFVLCRDKDGGLVLRVPIILISERLKATVNGHAYSYLRLFSDLGLMNTEEDFVGVSPAAKARRKLLSVLSKQERAAHAHWFGWAGKNQLNERLHLPRGLSQVRWLDISLSQLAARPALLCLIQDEVWDEICKVLPEVDAQIAQHYLPARDKGGNGRSPRVPTSWSHVSSTLLLGISEAKDLLLSHPSILEALLSSTFASKQETEKFLSSLPSVSRLQLQRFLLRCPTTSLRMAAFLLSHESPEARKALQRCDDYARYTFPSGNSTFPSGNAASGRLMEPLDFHVRAKALGRVSNILHHLGYYSSPLAQHTATRYLRPLALAAPTTTQRIKRLSPMQLVAA